jgi:enoyl-CoA hydratase/carnithine racemase
VTRHFPEPAPAAATGPSGIRTLRAGHVGVIVLSQPERRNAMTLEMWDSLAGVVEGFGGDPEIRVVVVRGEGTEAFSAGADISEFPELRTQPEDVRRYQESVVRAEDALIALRKPTIAMMHGACAGGGAGLAMSCALRFADDRLRFSIPAARLGVVYESEIVARLVREVGPAAAFDILVSGRTVEAEEALRIGLVSAVWPTAELETQVMAYVDRVAANAPLSIEGAWLAVRSAEGPGSDRWRDELAEVQWRALASADYREGVQAFLEKRRPTFSGE